MKIFLKALLLLAVLAAAARADEDPSAFASSLSVALDEDPSAALVNPEPVVEATPSPIPSPVIEAEPLAAAVVPAVDSGVISTTALSNEAIPVIIDDPTPVAIKTTASPSPSRSPAPTAASSKKYCKSGYQLVWHDEFTSTSSKKNWGYEAGNGAEFGIPGWGNEELQWYTNNTDNVNIAGGNLILTARKRSSADGSACPAAGCKFTSGRVRTYQKFSTYPRDKTGERTIRIETRMRLPKGIGMWPAFQMLPEASPANCSGCGEYGAWASSGAITVAQSVNAMKKSTGGLLFGGSWPDQTSATFEAALSTKAAYQKFALEWSLRTMRFYVNDKKVFETYSSYGGTKAGGWFTSAPTTRKNAPFDKPFHLIFNLAVGGTGTRATEAQVGRTLKEPKYLAVDYVRVCRK